MAFVTATSDDSVFEHQLLQKAVWHWARVMLTGLRVVVRHRPRSVVAPLTEIPWIQHTEASLGDFRSRLPRVLF
jgi:hypothetical protein